MNFSEIDNTLVCSFSERLDGSTCSTLEPELLRCTAMFKENKKNARLVFDLREVTFISSVFLRLCLIHHKSFEKGCFAITNVSEEVFKVFSVSGFTEIMNVTLNDLAVPQPLALLEQCEAVDDTLPITVQST